MHPDSPSERTLIRRILHTLRRLLLLDHRPFISL